MDTLVYTTRDRLMIRLRRAARALGLTWVRQKYHALRRRMCLQNLDPFDTHSLVLSLFRNLPADHPDHIELDAAGLEQYLDAQVKQAPGYRLDKCFERMLRDLGPTPDRGAWMSGGEPIRSRCVKAAFNLIVIDVLLRADEARRMNRDQICEFSARVKLLENIDQVSISAHKREIVEEQQAVVD